MTTPTSSTWISARSNDVDVLSSRNNESSSALDLGALPTVNELEVVGNGQLSTSAREAVESSSRDISANLGEAAP